jgi:hypothetical protein
MEILYFKDKINQKSTRFRINCLFCPALNIETKRKKFSFGCLFYKIKFTWSGYKTFNDHFNRFDKEQCPVKQI